jgi:lysophospholipase L1-like esterase
VVTFAKLGSWLRDGWLLVGIAILLFGLLEGGLSLALRLEHQVRQAPREGPDWRVEADTYTDRSWVTRYYEEFRASDAVRWMPYVYWRRGAYRGRYIDVDTNGIRHTLEPTAAASAAGSPIKIFMFGGSALWGTGARDDFTIPSALARELESKGLHAKVINFGESGYVSTQEVIALLLRLQDHEVPDLVILYDGVNDTYSAYQQRVAGLPQNEFKRVAEFNLSTDFDRLSATTLREAAARLATVRVLGAALQKLGVPAGPGPERSASHGFAAGHAAAPSEVARKYFGNLELLKALGAHYHFKYLAYWQPTLFEKTALTPYERGERAKARAFEDFFRGAYAAVSQQPREAEPFFRDISSVFSGVQQPIFLDWIHLGESGNEMIAKIMATDVSSLVR